MSRAARQAARARARWRLSCRSRRLCRSVSATAVFCCGTLLPSPSTRSSDLAIVVDGVRHAPTASGCRGSIGSGACTRRSACRGAGGTRRRSRTPSCAPTAAASGRRSRSGARRPGRGRAGRRGGARRRDARERAARHDRGGRADAAPSYDDPQRGGGGLIAVCMATFNPDTELLRTQVESIRAQTDRDWVCLVSDDCSEPERFEAIEAVVGGDARFVLSRSEGGWASTATSSAPCAGPAEAELVALSDQDDRWYPDKLETLRDAIGSARSWPTATCGGSTPSGRRARGDAVGGRRNNHTNLASLLISNTIAGASSLFRREVVDYALPFPGRPRVGLPRSLAGLVAMALGDVAYVDRPLYDYVQHPGAVLGRMWVAPTPGERRGGQRPDKSGLAPPARDQPLACGATSTPTSRCALRARRPPGALRGPAAGASAARCGGLIAADRSPLAWLWLAAARCVPPSIAPTRPRYGGIARAERSCGATLVAAARLGRRHAAPPDRRPPRERGIACDPPPARVNAFCAP